MLSKAHKSLNNTKRLGALNLDGSIAVSKIIVVLSCNLVKWGTMQFKCVEVKNVYFTKSGYYPLNLDTLNTTPSN